jgi:hypothetical protein
MADNAESGEKQNFVGEKKKSHGATRHCSYGTSDSTIINQNHTFPKNYCEVISG